MQELDKCMKILEFDKILKLLEKQAQCEESKQRILKITPLYDLCLVKKQLEKTLCAQTLCLRYGSPNFGNIKDIKLIVNKAKKGGVLSPAQLICILNILKTSQTFINWRKHFENHQTVLDNIFDKLKQMNILLNNIEQAIISEEELNDNASFDLFNIRHEIKEANFKVREKLKTIIRSQARQKYLQEDVITIKNGRYVVPVKAEYKNEIKGFVHDASSSGSTFFVEPLDVVELNNRVKILKSKEQDEIFKILQTLSRHVGDEANIILNNYNLLIHLNIIFAKAKLAIDMDAFMPKITNTATIDLKRARHPLIKPNVVVPIDIVLGSDFTTLLITGPNTGGKTVALKTVGLFVLMIMSGLMIPADEKSTISIFENVLTDIGDGQSIEQNLSTFSGHMTNIVSIIKNANKNSLILLDELCFGTDPIEGAALAIAILNELKSKKAKVISTTHYSELKMYALNTKGVQIASCEFDIETLKPKYNIVIGIPGKSNAFKIAQKLGLEDKIIKAAKNTINDNNLAFEDIVKELNLIKDKIKVKSNATDKLKCELLEEYKKVDELKQSIQIEEQSMIDDFKKTAEPALELIDELFDKAVSELNEIKKANDLQKLENLRVKVQCELKSALKKVYSKNQKISLDKKFKKGDIVFIDSLGQEGYLLSELDSNNFASVKIQNITAKINVSNLKHINEIKEKKQNAGRVFKSLSSKSLKQIETEVHLRMLTVNEALDKLDKFIDEAIIAGLHNIVVVHGKGTGTLKNAVHQYLKSCKVVRSFRLGVYGEGEDGVTIVELK